MSKFFTYLRTGTFYEEEDSKYNKKVYKATEVSKNEQLEKLELDKNDVRALIIAAFQVLLPFLIGVILIFAAVIFLFTKVL